ncbi:MAG TPA: hypothetical protein VNG53_11690 [Bacteroidia bacterium]|nr:hypothetical protein [Bacteroidia bacterium]
MAHNGSVIAAVEGEDNKVALFILKPANAVKVDKLEELQLRQST